MPNAASSAIPFAVPSPTPGPGPGGAGLRELDAGALQRLRDLDPTGGGQLVQRVMRAFDSSLHRLADQLVVARSAGDVATLRHVAHTLKSSSASVGALTLARLCTEIEAVVRDGSPAPLDPLLDAFEVESRSVLAAIRPLLGPQT